MSNELTLDPKQLVWRCRRGVRELDVLLGRFLESDYRHLNTEEQLAFEQLLDVQDPIIMDWLFGKKQPDNQNIKNIVNILKQLMR